jgi:hypothetical protein|tara:strand:- start:64 stop:675 length:612 start_codon:yes stop_codon:yes gene_type:complete
MNLKEAKAITGGLSNPGKMPGFAYNLPTWACITGTKLRDVEGSTCSGCYAHERGRYRFPNVKEALNRRLKSLDDPKWIEAMTVLVAHYSLKVPFFRWHDSGDLQSVQHLKNIFEVCNATPQVEHWIPTREAKFLPLNTDSIPKNLIMRLSGHKIDKPAAGFWPWTSTVVTQAKSCPAAEQENQCKDCRACWDRGTANIAYPLH